MDDPAEKLFLSLIAKFTIDDIRDCILRDIDLSEIVRKELPEYLESFKMMVAAYRQAHEGIDKNLADINKATDNVIEWLKVQRPDLGYEIAMYKSLPTLAQAGFIIEPTSPGMTTTSTTFSNPDVHVGKEWVKKNLNSLSRLLL